jgi:RNA ligase
MTGCSSYDVWENLMLFDRLPEELLTKVPDEFYSWIKTLEVKLRGEYQKLLDEYEYIFKQIMLTPRTADRKTFAAAALKHKHSSILFNMLDGREPRDLIWRLIKPAYSKPFADKG